MTGPFFPRIKRKECSPVDPTISCDGRAHAQRNGSFYYDSKREGYCATVLQGPMGLPILLDGCPFCFCLLPGARARRYWETGLEGKNPSLGQPDGEGAE